jgi:hypothetical protein
MSSKRVFSGSLSDLALRPGLEFSSKNEARNEGTLLCMNDGTPAR